MYDAVSGMVLIFHGMQFCVYREGCVYAHGLKIICVCSHFRGEGNTETAYSYLGNEASLLGPT